MDDEVTGGLKVIPGEDFPLPPAELVDQLDNSANSAAPTTPPAAAVADRIELDFVGDAPIVRINLRWPFRIDGREVHQVTVRALSVVETARVLRDVGAGTAGSYDIYAAMTGLPAAVIQALPGEDGERVTDAAWDFLPQWARPPMASASPSTPANGES